MPCKQSNTPGRQALRQAHERGEAVSEVFRAVSEVFRAVSEVFRAPEKKPPVPQAASAVQAVSARTDAQLQGSLIMLDTTANGELPCIATGTVNGPVAVAVNGELPCIATGTVNGPVAVAVNGELLCIAGGAQVQPQVHSVQHRSRTHVSLFCVVSSGVYSFTAGVRGVLDPISPG